MYLGSILDSRKSLEIAMTPCGRTRVAGGLDIEVGSYSGAIGHPSCTQTTLLPAAGNLEAHSTMLQCLLKSGTSLPIDRN